MADMAGDGINALEILKSTNRSNCGQCALPNCMAFSALVARGQKDPGDCPHLDAALVMRLRSGAAPGPEWENRPESVLARLVQDVRAVDLPRAAKRLGGWMEGERLALRCLGRVFEVDRKGGLHAMCHINPWVHLAVLQYVVHGEGRDPAGEWTTFRDVPGAREWGPFFAHRCEAVLHELADRRTELFLDVVSLFGRRIEASGAAAEHAILLRPLPKVPFLFCYSPAEGRFDSVFNLLFDRSIASNLKAEGTYMLAQGITEMLKNIMARHGDVAPG